MQVWDYLISGFKPELLGINSAIDHLHLLNYICLALIRFSRSKYLVGDYTDCLIIAMKPLDLDHAEDIIEEAETFRRMLNPQDFLSSPLIPLEQRLLDF